MPFNIEEAIAKIRTKRALESTTKTKETKAKRKCKKIEPLSTVLAEIAKKFERVVGIDMSLNNPGMCIVCFTTKTIQLFGLRNRKCETATQRLIEDPESPFHKWLVQVNLIEQISPIASSNEAETSTTEETSSTVRMKRYDERVRVLCSIIGESNAKTMIAIEDYAYKVRVRSKNNFQCGYTEAQRKLTELGGILRWSLMQRGFNLYEIVPSKVKRLFSSYGGAKKFNMCNTYEDILHMPSLYEMLNIKRRETSNSTPHPIEDMVDAFAVAISVMYCSLEPPH